MGLGKRDGITAVFEVLNCFLAWHHLCEKITYDEAEVEWKDSDGDVVRFQLEGDILIYSVNGKKGGYSEHRSGDDTGVVTRLKWEHQNGDVRDQFGWGGDVPISKVMHLHTLAERAGIPQDGFATEVMTRTLRPSVRLGSSEQRVHEK